MDHRDELDEQAQDSFMRFWESSGMKECVHLRKMLDARRVEIERAISAPVETMQHASALHDALAAIYVIGWMESALWRIEQRLNGRGESVI